MNIQLGWISLVLSPLALGYQPVVVEPRSGSEPSAYAIAFGGSPGEDTLVSSATDREGNFYLLGDTRSPRFPVSEDAIQKDRSGQSDLFVTKVDANGFLVYSTLLGGRGNEFASALAVDVEGNVYVAASTTADFYQSRGSTGRFVLFRFSPGAKNLDYVYDFEPGLAGTIRAIAVPPGGGLIFAGESATLTLRTTERVFQPRPAGLREGFIGKLNAAGTSLVFLSYLGGSAEEQLRGIAVDSAGNIAVTGHTYSADFPTTAGAVQSAIHPGACSGATCPDAFLSIIHPSGTTLSYSTYLGGAGVDYAQSVAFAGNSTVLLTGFTLSHDFPVTEKAWQTTHSRFGSDAFIAKIDTEASKLVFSTYLGAGEGITGGDDEALSIAVDSSGRGVVAGRTRSQNFPQSDPVQTGRGEILNPDGTAQRCRQPGAALLQPCWDGFVAVISESGDRLLHSTFLGGAGDDSIAGVAASGERFLVAASASAFFPALRHDGSASSNLAAVAFQFRPDNVLTRADWLRQPTSNRRSDFILARGAIATLYARNIAPSGTLMVATSPLPREVAGVRLTIAGIPAPILGVAAVETGELVHFQVPWEVPGSEAPVPIILSRGTVSSLPIFAWTVRDWNMEILRQTDGETAWSMRNTPESLTIFATGMGPVSPPITSGLAPEDNRHRALLLPTAQWNGAAVPVEDCFLMPGLAGIYRIDIRVPAEPASVTKASLTVAVEGPSLSISDTVTVILPQD